MASNNQTFDSQDKLITQADQRLQWDKLTIEAMQHQIPIQVIPISSPNLPGLPHIGTVTETKRINGKQFIFMQDCVRKAGPLPLPEVRTDTPSITTIWWM
jgi:hypothetical protein